MLGDTQDSKVNNEKGIILILLLFSYAVYIVLNEIFFNLGLIIAHRKLVVFPYITGLNCGQNIGYDEKRLIYFVVFIILRVLLILFTKYYLVSKVNFTQHVLGIYLVTDFLFVVFSLLFPFVHWDFYFYTAFPIFGINKMFSYPNWLGFLSIGLFDFFIFDFLFKKLNKTYVYYLLCAFLSFVVAFLIYFIVYDRVILESMLP